MVGAEVTVFPFADDANATFRACLANKLGTAHLTSRCCHCLPVCLWCGMLASGIANTLAVTVGLDISCYLRYLLFQSAHKLLQRELALLYHTQLPLPQSCGTGVFQHRLLDDVDKLTTCFC